MDEGPGNAVTVWRASHDGHFLQAHQLLDAFAREAEQRGELVFTEGSFFGGRLDFNNVAGTGHGSKRMANPIRPRRSPLSFFKR